MGVLMSLPSPPLGTSARPIHLKRTRREAAGRRRAFPRLAGGDAVLGARHMATSGAAPAAAPALPAGVKPVQAPDVALRRLQDGGGRMHGSTPVFLPCERR